MTEPVRGDPHRLITRCGCRPPGAVVEMAPRVIAALAKAPELVSSARRSGSDVGFLVADLFAFGGKDVPGRAGGVPRKDAGGASFNMLAEFFPNFSQLDEFERLATFGGVPTATCGTKDKLTSVRHRRLVAKRMPEAKLVECEGAGHMVIFEAHDKVNSTLADLVAATAR